AFGIQSIPTMMFIPKTGKPHIAQGALSKEQCVEQIDNFLLKK
ncbi:thiol reductase thioredoxin, partial [Parabacteroides merdae]|nr:thiol reductase thioredoxin [Parabacteroides merdae]